MATITIVGSGVMGTSIAVPALDRGNRINLVGSPLDDHIIEGMKQGLPHPKLDEQLEGDVHYFRQDELEASTLAKSDIVLLGVSSAGIDWILHYLNQFEQLPPRLMMITKGLDVAGSGKVRVLPYRIDEAFSDRGCPAIIGVGGPCIARELANRTATSVVFGHSNESAAEFARTSFETDYYHIRLSDDLAGVEANAPLKNFMASGVSAAWSRFPDRFKNGSRQYNPTAAIFEQAVFELGQLTEWLGGQRETAYGLAGIGDLFVTVNAGRNSRLGLHLGEDKTVSEALAGPLKGETVEGVDTGRALGPALRQEWTNNPSLAEKMPLTRALLNSMLDDKVFAYDTGAFWHR